MSIRAVILTALVASSSLLSACATGAAGGAMATDVIAAAVADAGRPDADRQRDADRKPAEMLAFAGVKPGSKVAEMLPGQGYFTRIFSKAVGSSGAVYALVPARAPNAPANAPDFAAPMRALAADAAYGNVKVGSLDPGGSLPELVDVVWTSLNYHDLHNRPNADLMPTNKMVLSALKPGGLYIVVDHAAMAGSGKSATSTFHRIDPEFVKAEVLAAGFEFVGSSDALKNPNDPHNVNPRDLGRGKSDQFIHKFRKPKK
jgi:predicted methyltransferase